MNTLTEDEARTKWCPMARVRDGDAGSYNRWITVRDDHGCRETAWCIASACMAWRWHAERQEGFIPAGWDDPEPTRGYCGAFGRPDQ